MIDQNSPSVGLTAKQLRDALRNAFTLGWQIVELQCRLQVNVPTSSADRRLGLPGMWHSCFNRIAGITSGAFPAATTANTLYSPPAAVALPYLYPLLAPEPAPRVTPSGAAAVLAVAAPRFDYADVGVAAIQHDDADKKPQLILRDFQLYDVTRRAINCLTLLCTREEDSLIPDLLKDYRSDLLTQLCPTLPQSGKSEEERARDLVAGQAVKFLEAWHGYLRQNYYTGGQIPDNNLELVAYEAGHAMSALSWELLLDTLQLEAIGTAKTALAIEDAWNTTFTDQAIIHLQHEISALSSALDSAYYLERPEEKVPSDPTEVVASNPDLPSQSIQAVKNSLDYWIAAVKWISQNEGSFRNSDELVWRKSLRLALTEQTNVWQMLMTGQESLRGYNVETAAHKIMEDITDEIGSGLRQGFKSALQQTEQMLTEIKKEATVAVGNVFNFGRSACWILLGLGFFITVAGAIALIPNLASQVGRSLGFTGVLSGIGSFLLGGYKWLGLSAFKDDATQRIQGASDTPVVSEGSALLSRLEGAAQSAESAILKAFQQGYEQMRVELDSLNRSIAVTYPLVEFFGKELKLDSTVDFLTDIFWSGTKREEEVKRVIRAAFGGLSLMVDPNTSPTKAT
jgi:hypothetical protein